MRPFAVNGLVPYLGEVVPIQGRRPNGEHGWLYCLHTRKESRELLIHGDVPHAVLVASIGAFAHYAVGQRVLLRGRYAMNVLVRKWSFRKGTVIYALSSKGSDKASAKVFTQEELFMQVEADDVPDQYRTSERWNIEESSWDS